MGGFNPIKMFTDSLKRTRAEQNADDTAAQSRINQFKALGMKELGYNRSGALLPSQEAELQDFEQKGIQESNKFADMAKVSDSFRASMQDHFMIESSVMRESMEEKHLARGIQALGYSLEETKALIDAHKKEREAENQLYSGMMKAVGTAIAIFALA